MKRIPPPGRRADAASDSRRFAVFGHAVEITAAKAGLHVVATPIGNLGDVTLRALETLAGVDLIACEDTRVTSRLLNRYLIRTPLTPYHDHNAEIARPKLLARLTEGASIALVSDAGTPLISDPGYRLVREAASRGVAVTPVPGPSASLAALSIAGLPTDRFLFEGFLPVKDGQRRARIGELAAFAATLVLYEAGSRVAETLRALAAVLGDREAVVCRELTKLHEETRRGALTELAAEAGGEETRGEFVILVGPPAAGAREGVTDEELDSLLRRALDRQSVKDAVGSVAAATGHKRRAVYDRALSLMRSRDDGDG